MTRRFAAYAVVGAFGAFVHYAVTIVCVEALDWNVLVASSAGFVAALCTQFAVNRRFVFASDASLAGSFGRYAATSIFGLALNLAILDVTTRLLGWHYLAGAAIAIGVVTPVNYAINRSWSFRSR